MKWGVDGEGRRWEMERNSVLREMEEYREKTRKKAANGSGRTCE